ncbi:hypothetical protein [Streptomyces sp. enrichment culture]|uniref:hypothetical protein n=1 Tax=Streptomyces sp. enrichment culture TaxID=1795815 RepID=UPI003F55B5A5
MATILRTTPTPERTTPDPVERTTPAPVAPVERTTPAPVAPVERTTPAPVAPVERTTPATSGNTPAPRLLHPLDPRTIQDLNCLMDPATGQLPAGLVRAIRTAADHRRTSMRATAHRLATAERTSEEPPATGRATGRAQVAP